MEAALPPASLAWVRAPRQTRSHLTLDRILDATEALLEEKAFDSISVAEIVKRAGSSVGSFYARFGDKDCLLRCLQERLFEESRATAQQALAPDLWEHVPAPDMVAAFIGFMLGAYRERQGLRRALLGRQATQADYRERAAEVAADACHKLARLFTARGIALETATLAVAVDMCHRVVFSVLDQNLLFSEHPPAGLTLSDAELARQLAIICTRYLALDEPADRSPRRSERTRGSKRARSDQPPTRIRSRHRKKGKP